MDYQKPILQTGTKQQILVDGLKLQTYKWGNGDKKVLLIHGWESNSARWSGLKEKLLAEGYTVIGVDAPAHGNSAGNYIDVPLYGKAIAQIAKKYEPHFAIGHSLGGTTLLYQHHVEPIKGIEKFVLLAPASELSNLMKGFQNTLGLKPIVMQAMEDDFEKRYGLRFKDFSMPKMASHFSIPTLLVHDKGDKIVRYEESLALDKAWEAVDLLITEGLGHGLRNEEVYDSIITFLQQK